MFFLGFNNLKYFNLFSEYFIGIMVIYIFVVFVLITSNIYGVIVQSVISYILAYLLFLSFIFLLEEEMLFYNFFKNTTFVLSFIGFNKSLSFSLLSNYAKMLVILFSFFYLLIISNDLKNFKIFAFEYLLLLKFSILGLIFLCCTNDLLSSFLSIELISLTSYFLAGFQKSSSYSLEAGIKYLIIGALSSSFFLLGSSLIYGYLGSINFEDIYFLTVSINKLLFSFNNSYFFFNVAKTGLDLNFYLEIGVILILLSLFIKLALGPVHSWSIDVYEGSPSTSTFFFSTITKLSFFIFLYRFCFVTFDTNNQSFWFLFLLSVGLFSVIIGSFGGLYQKKIKSLLAYSSISHMGYSVLAITSFSKFSFEIFIFYIISYILANIIVWYTILSLKKVRSQSTNKKSKDIGDFILLSQSNKFLSVSLSLAFFSLAGIPPLLGFLAKIGIFLNLILEKFYVVAMLIILCGTVSTFYYLRIIKLIYFENKIVSVLYKYNSTNALIFCFLVFLLGFLFIKPTLVYIVIHKMLLFENIS